MCGKQAGLKSQNSRKMPEEVIHPFLKKHTASRRSNGIRNTLFEQFAAEE
jgi:hypothetical protein